MIDKGLCWLGFEVEGRKCYLRGIIFFVVQEVFEVNIYGDMFFFFYRCKIYVKFRKDQIQEICKISFSFVLLQVFVFGKRKEKMIIIVLRKKNKEVVFVLRVVFDINFFVFICGKRYCES